MKVLQLLEKFAIGIVLLAVLEAVISGRLT